MKSALTIIFCFFIISCKNENSHKLGDVEFIFHESGRISTYIGGDFFESPEANILNNEGIKLSRKGRYEDAKIKLLKAKNAEPDNPTILNNLGNVEHNLKKYKLATVYFEKSLLLSDSLYLNAGHNLGLLYWKDYEFEKSAQILEYVLSKSNNEIEKACANYQLAKTYLDMNKCEKSKVAFDNADKGLKNISGFDEKLKHLREEIKNCVQHNI